MPDDPLASELFSPGLTAPWFGRDGLYTRDPTYLAYLADDHAFTPYGLNRLHPPATMIEWMATRRLGFTLDEVAAACRKLNPVLRVVVRRATVVRIPGQEIAADQGSTLEFSYRDGLIKLTTSTGALAHGTADSARGDRTRGDGCRP